MYGHSSAVNPSFEDWVCVVADEEVGVSLFTCGSVEGVCCFAEHFDVETLFVVVGGVVGFEFLLR